MGLRARDHERRELFGAKCSKCGKQAQVPWDPKKEPARVVMCRDCRDFYAP
ncbi:MAG TPA: CxxC-x17-CxxC domain-containing protein [Candidatus Thermoplasmatota archaeon]|jgi:CxxC-x17-CxxC domain-containing protein|nr:CxxC-x17-CxxC domain-containing protein [Candidatus Thermoplasmatota archaeon]